MLIEELKDENCDLESSAQGYFRLVAEAIARSFVINRLSAKYSPRDLLRMHKENLYWDTMMLKLFVDCSDNFEYDKLERAIVLHNKKRIKELENKYC